MSSAAATGIPNQIGPEPNDSATNEISCEGLEEKPMSKRQLKRMAKRELYVKTLKDKRKVKREKERTKRKMAKELDLPIQSRKYLKQITMADSSCRVRLALDLSFSHLMTEKDTGKCVKQIMRCYSMNRRSGAPCQFYLTSFGQQIENHFQKHNGYKSWDVNYEPKSYLECFNKTELIYLTGDSSEVIREFDASKVYIIGGLVDHNQHKGLCLKAAIDSNIAHARLPIDDHLEMKSSKILTIDQVFAIVLDVCHGSTWRDALLKTIPLRKGAKVKTSCEISASDANVDT